MSPDEEKRLKNCLCPACQQYTMDGLKRNRSEGFCNRATHNLWVLLEEGRLIQEHLTTLNDYKGWYIQHLDNTTYRPLINKLVYILL